MDLSKVTCVGSPDAEKGVSRSAEAVVADACDEPVTHPQSVHVQSIQNEECNERMLFKR